MGEPFWFNPDASEDDKDWQVQLGVLFNARIRWLDDGIEGDVVMATYDTEDMPEDDLVFFTFGGEGYSYQGLVNELKEWNDEWEVLECDLYEQGGK